jgi:hypothetical protein
VPEVNVADPRSSLTLRLEILRTRLGLRFPGAVALVLSRTVIGGARAGAKRLAGEAG